VTASRALTLMLTAVAVAAPREALACPVCFGQSDSPLALAMNTGILFMLGVIVAVLCCFGAFIVYLARRAKLAESLGAARNPQEGTAQC
jgi:hypothetical protein